jgi:stringent starvation protein B
MAESSTKPYLIRAIHEWCADQGYTPYISVSVDEKTVVPRGFVKAGEIVLNISVMATNKLKISNDLIEFQARFGGVGHELSIPIENVSAIYARETGHGMAFDVSKPLAVVPPPVDTLGSVTLVTNGEFDEAKDDGIKRLPAPERLENRSLSEAKGQSKPVSARVTPMLRTIEGDQQSEPPSDQPPDPNKPTRPHLTRVK